MKHKKLEEYIEIFKSKEKINDSKMHDYLTFVFSRMVCESSDEYVERHHILPISNYPEFSSFNENGWNMARLTPSDHVIAHYLLCRATNNMSYTYAFVAMISKNRYKLDIDNLFSEDEINERKVK